MEEQEKNNAGQHPIENVLNMSAYDMAKSVNASIGITAYGKACFFSQDVLEKVSKGMPDGATLQIVHLIQICREAGQQIADERFSISLVSLDTTEELWLESVNKPSNEKNEHASWYLRLADVADTQQLFLIIQCKELSCKRAFWFPYHS